MRAIRAVLIRECKARRLHPSDSLLSRGLQEIVAVEIHGDDEFGWDYWSPDHVMRSIVRAAVALFEAARWAPPRVLH